ncbi:DUF2220 family protein [Sulfurimonas sp. SWIR-19]|uniref:Wadjet anti-phage system protein JetD domain-containing protein n=1 Tax=Sulfurimonas sp. SWIR-19 TaxID=2878390 RepID=UPI001CF2290F|nr:DUF3322 and DUF2220 domain-containing protein [Sulfurimonas sp. SWIR-19]UCN00023.1 DUF2220 family protein [Sulfurimonas sp. SWIR-19]
MDFYNVAAIQKRLQRLYDSGGIFRLYIQNKPFTPVKIPLKKPKEQELLQAFSLILKQKEKLERSGYPLEYRAFHFKKMGMQKLPVFVVVNDKEQFLLLINEKEEYALFVQWYEYLFKHYPKLKELFFVKPRLVVEYAKEWEKFVLILGFFTHNPSPNIYIREISLKGIDTKYIQKHLKILDILLSCILEREPLASIKDFAFEKRYGLKYILPQVRFRILDERLRMCGCDDITLTLEQFEALETDCQRVFVIENKITFLSLPQLQSSIAIFGSGYNIGILKNTRWLETKEIYYWGDIDMDGFAILSKMRSYFPQTKSLMMDIKTLQQYKDRSVSYKGAKETELKHLTQEETVVYKRLASHYYGENFRLEQEMIPFDEAREVLHQETIK